MKVVVISLFVIVVAGDSTSGAVVPVPAATVVSGPSLVRTPSFDSAVIKSDRVGGNFAYSTVEGHAYASISPVVQRVVEPVAVSYETHQVPLASPGGYVGVPPVAAYVPQQHVISAPSYLFGSPFFSHPGIGISFSPVAANPAQFHPLAPVSGSFGPVVGPVAQKPIADAPQPPVGTAIDEDTVSVEAAP